MATHIISDEAYSQKNFHGVLKRCCFEPQIFSDTFDETFLESSQDDNIQLIFYGEKRRK